MIDCLERFGDRIDWAMVILGPLEPWPGEFIPAGGQAPRVKSSSRVSSTMAACSTTMCSPGHDFAEYDHHGVSVPAGWVRGGPLEARADAPAGRAPRPDHAPARVPGGCPGPAERARRRAHPDPEGAGPDARPIEDKRAELAALDGKARIEARLSRDQELEEIRAIGDNSGSMALKGAPSIDT